MDGNCLPSDHLKAAEYFCGANRDKYPASPSMISDSSGDVLITAHQPITDKVSYLFASPQRAYLVLQSVITQTTVVDWIVS